MFSLRIILAVTLAAALGGCTSATQSGTAPLLEGDDMLRVTEKMAGSLAADPGVQAEIQKSGALKVVVEPAENWMRAEVLPTGAKEAFTARIRTLLSHQAHDNFVWIVNKQEYYSAIRRQRERPALGYDLGPAPESTQPQYRLYAKFYSMTQESSEHRSAFYSLVFELTDLERRRVLWTDSYEIKKAAVKGFLD